MRLARIADFSAASPVPFVRPAVAPGATVRTDGWQAYRALVVAGCDHAASNVRASGDPAHVALPAVHRVASLLNRWLLGTHHGAAGHEHLDA